MTKLSLHSKTLAQGTQGNKQTKTKGCSPGAGEAAQLPQCLPSVHQVLSLITSTAWCFMHEIPTLEEDPKLPSATQQVQGKPVPGTLASGNLLLSTRWFSHRQASSVTLARWLQTPLKKAALGMEGALDFNLQIPPYLLWDESKVRYLGTLETRELCQLLR